MTIVSRSRPRCPQCGSPTAKYRGESYCANCTTYGLPPELSTHQVLLLLVLRGRGWPCVLVEYLIHRCSATQAELDALIALGLVEINSGTYDVTRDGLKRLVAEKATRQHWI